MTIRFIGRDAWPGDGSAAEPRPEPKPKRAAASTPPPDDAQAASRVDWLPYWRSVYKRRWPILLLALVAVGVVALYAQQLQPVYRSTSTMLVESGKAKILSIEEVYNAMSQDREYFQTQVEILRSYQVALHTVVATRLWDEPEFDPRTPVRSWQGQLKDLASPPPETPPWTSQRLAEAAVAKYLGAISIEPVRLSQLVKISFDANDPALAARVADATANSFIEVDREARLKLNQSVNGLLQDRMVALREKLRQSEEELQRFREGSGLVSVSGSPGVAGQRLAEVGQRLVTASVRRTELESAYQQVERISDTDALSVPAVVQQPGVVEARNRATTAALLVEELTRTLGDQHSRVLDARTALAAAQRELTVLTRSAIASLKREVAASRETERSLQAALGAARTAVQGVNRQEFQLGVLEREVLANRQLYELFLSRTKETGVSNNLQAAVARIVDPARPATAPLRPNKTQMVLTAFLLVLLMGSALAIARDRLAGTVQGTDEAEYRLRHPVLATLPAVHPSKVLELNSAFLYDPRSDHSDAIRAARTSIVLSEMLISHKLMLVTSALPGEGKTSFSTNLALALAQAKRTVLVDCDLRNPQISFRLGLHPKAKGLTDLLLHGAELKDCVHSIPDSTLLVMPAGDVQAMPEELLLSSTFRDAMQALAARSDMVLMDSPAISAGSDALILAQEAHDTIFVVKSRVTSQAHARRGLDQLRRAGASILGLVLTNAEPPRRRAVRTRGGFARARSTAGVVDA